MASGGTFGAPFPGPLSHAPHMDASWHTPSTEEEHAPFPLPKDLPWAGKPRDQAVKAAQEAVADNPLMRTCKTPEACSEKEWEIWFDVFGQTLRQWATNQKQPASVHTMLHADSVFYGLDLVVTYLETHYWATKRAWAVSQPDKQRLLKALAQVYWMGVSKDPLVVRDLEAVLHATLKRLPLLLVHDVGRLLYAQVQEHGVGLNYCDMRALALVRRFIKTQENKAEEGAAAAASARTAWM